MCFLKTSKAYKNSLTFIFTFHFENKRENVENIKINNSWNKNTSILVRGGNIRMQFLHKAAKFTNNSRDLKQIYISQVRSKLEQSAVVWHSSLTAKNENDLERIQKAALRVILRDRY